MELIELKLYQKLIQNLLNFNMKKLRACPICPNCGSKKFERLKDSELKVRCLSCNKIIPI